MPAAAVADPGNGDGAPVVLSTSRLDQAAWRSSCATAASASPQDDLGRVFDPYFTTRRTGSGLGLAIAKNVVEGLGGTITAAQDRRRRHRAARGAAGWIAGDQRR